MSKQKILITSWMIKADHPSVQKLKDEGFEVAIDYWHGGRNEEEMIRLIPGYSGAILSIDPVTTKVLEVADSLKVVSRTGVGYDAIDVPACTAHGVVVCTAPGTNNKAVADFAFALVLAAGRGLMQNERNVRSGKWERVIGDDVGDKTIGIVGFGSIGKQLALRAAGFGMRILAYDIIKDESFAAAHGVTFVSLEQLLREADYVSLHLLLNESTDKLINEDRLRLMKPNAYLINTSRGGVVDEEALYKALKEKWISGAGLDVFRQEPPWGSPLLELDNVVVAPHVAGISKGAQEGMVQMSCENALRVLKGQPPLYAVNPEALRKQPRVSRG